jgi:hypothetical protein
MNTKNTDENLGVTPEVAEPRSSASTASRRRFISGGLAVAVPTVLTLSSRSALACHCKSPSANGSVSGSQAARGSTDFGNQPPKTYSAWMSLVPWPNTLAAYTKNSPLKTLFPYFTSTTKIKDLTNPFQQDLVTAFLNVTNSSIVSANCLTIAQLREMADGSYSPATGVTWGPGEIHTYLQSNYLLGY